MKRIFTTLSQKWPEYLLEILVITVGILGAYALNNWNEQRKSKIQQLEILRDIESGLREDFNDLNYNLNAHREILNSQDILISFLDQKVDYHDSLGNHFQRINGNTVFIAHEGPFETLKSMGIGLISNDSLRDAIVFVYDRVYDYHDEAEQIYNDYFDLMVKTQSSHFSEWSAIQSPMFPIDPNNMLADREYRYQVGTLRNINLFVIPIMEETIDAVAKLRKHLNDEIVRLEN